MCQAKLQGQHLTDEAAAAIALNMTLLGQVRGLKRRLVKVDAPTDTPRTCATNLGHGLGAAAVLSDEVDKGRHQGSASENVRGSDEGLEVVVEEVEREKLKDKRERERERLERRPPTREARSRSVQAFGSSIRQVAAKGFWPFLCVHVRVWGWGGGVEHVCARGRESAAVAYCSPSGVHARARAYSCCCFVRMSVHIGRPQTLFSEGRRETDCPVLAEHIARGCWMQDCGVVAVPVALDVLLHHVSASGLGVLNGTGRESRDESPAKDKTRAASTPPATPPTRAAAPAVQPGSGRGGGGGIAGPIRVISRDI